MAATTTPSAHPSAITSVLETIKQEQIDEGFKLLQQLQNDEIALLAKHLPDASTLNNLAAFASSILTYVGLQKAPAGPPPADPTTPGP